MCAWDFATSSAVGVSPVPIAQTGSYAIIVLLAVAPIGTEPAIWRDNTPRVAPASRSARVSPIQMMATRPARHAASAFACTTRSSSWQSMRRSACPTITWLAPASLSISAEMHPVCAPHSRAWQSWAPTFTGVWLRISAARVRSVAGTQTSASVSASRPCMKPRPIACNSGSDPLVPFIFQFPPTSGRTPRVIRLLPLLLRLRLPSLAKTGDKAIDSGGEGRYCPSTIAARQACQKAEWTMLDVLRNAAGTWVAKTLLSILLLSFTLWGISGKLVSGLGAGNSVLTAGGTSVSANEYRLAYDRQISALSQQFGQRITRDQATALGIDQQVLSQLVAGALLDEQAREMGLGLSKDRLAELTREDPAFQGPDGKFSRQQFDHVLQQVGMRPEGYLKSRGQAAVRQQIIEAVSDGLTAPDAFLQAVALYKGEDRTVDYLALPKALVEPIEEPQADALGKWFEENKKTYAAPEYRKLAYVKLAPEDIADPKAITDEQVKADYEANRSKFATPETRTIEQIVFKSAEAAKAARDSIRSGSTFEDVVKAEGKTQADVQLGTLTKEKIADSAVADAAFNIQSNDVSEVIQSAFGPVLIRVTAIKPEVVRPLEEVKEEIRKDLALVEANRVLLDAHDSYEDARAGGATLQEAAAKLKLNVVTVDAIDRRALRPDGSVVNDLPESQELLRAAFETEVSVDSPAINLPSNGFLFYEVQAITPARDRTLDEVHEKVVQDWKAAETQSRLLNKAGELQKRVKDGAARETIAGELKLEKQTKRGLKREADDADFGKPGIAAIFGVPEGGTGLVPSPAGDGQLLFKVTEVFEPAGAGPDAVPDETKKVFAQGIADDLVDQLVARLQSEYAVTVDRAAIDHALAF